jgi:hypothetical protein
MSVYTIQSGDTLNAIAARNGMSLSQLLALNPQFTNPDRIFPNQTVNLGNPPAAQPTPPPAKTTPQTIAQVAKVSVPDFVQDPNAAQVGNQLRTQATQQVDDSAIRAAARARIQAQIDAINAAVADQIANFRNTTGKNREGQAYALAAAGGRTGSATGESEVQNVEKANDQEAQTYQDSANTKINALFGAANTDAQAEIDAKRAAIQQGIDKYFQFLDAQSSQKKDQITAFVKKMISLGVDPATLSDQDFQKLSDQYGFSRDQLISLYNDTKTSQDQTAAKNASDLASNNQFNLSEGQSRYQYDPATGQTKLLASVPKSDGSSGTGSVSIAKDSPQYKVAQDLAYGGLTFQQFRTLYAYSRDINQKLGIYQLATQLNPAFNAADFEAGYEFYKDPQVRKQLSAADNAISNIDTVIQLSNDAQRSGITAVNKIELPAKYSIGDKAVAKFDQAQMLLADEISGVLGYGSGTDMKLKLGIDVIDGNLNPETFASNMEQLREFLQKKKSSLLSQTSVYGDPTVGGQKNNPQTNLGTSTPTTYTSSSGKTYYIPN